MKEDQIYDEICDACNEDFQKGVDKIVNDVDGYSRKDHHNKKQEVKAAFDNDNNQKDSYSATDTVATGATATAGLAGATTEHRIEEKEVEKPSNVCGTDNIYEDNRQMDCDITLANKYNDKSSNYSDKKSMSKENDSKMCGCGDDNMENSFKGSDEIGGENAMDSEDMYDDSNDLIAVVEEINIYQFDTDDDTKNN